MPEPPAPAPRDPGARRLLALAVALGALLLLLGLGLPLWGSEGRWLVVARGMVRSGDAFSLNLGGQPYFDKPFGSYWLVVVAAWMLGGFREAAGRLPCILALLATLLVTFELGRRTLGERAGAVAALLLALAARVLFWGHLASADPQNLLGITLALLLVLRASEGGGIRTLALLGAVAGATTLMKGLPGVALPIFVALLWAAVTRRAGWLSPRGIVLGALACLALAGTPFIVARLQQGNWDALQLLVRESVVRAVEPFDHREPWWFYLVNQFELLAPWSLLLPAAVLHALVTLRGPPGARDGLARLRTSEEQRRAAYPLFCYVAVLLFYSLSGSKRSYYLLPIAPFAALLVADLLLATPARLAAGLRRAGLAGLGLVGLLAGLAALGIGLLRLVTDAAPAALVARVPEAAQAFAMLPPWLMALGLVVVPAARLLRPAPGRVPLLPVLAVLAQTALLQRGVAEPVQASFDPLPAFCDAVHAIVPPGADVDIRDAEDAKLRFYLDPPPCCGEARWRIVTRRHVPRILADERGWRPVRDPRLDAAVWPESDAHAYVLLERADEP